MIFVGFGNKAQQGKDTCAQIWKEERPSTIILHFADALKEEVAYDGFHPLITVISTQPRRVIVRLPNKNDKFIKYVFKELEGNITDLFLKYMDKNDLDVHYGMTEKDPELLQLWGTEFRRKLFSEDFWIKMFEEKLKQFRDQTIDYVLIPDTRFINEYKYIQALDGYYIKVIREDFTDNSRNPNHLSETELDNVIPNYTISAKSGDLESIRKQIKEIIYKIENNKK